MNRNAEVGSTYRALNEFLVSRIPPDAARRWSGSFAQLETRFELPSFHATFAQAGRVLGERAVDREHAQLGVWGADHCGRAALLALAATVLEPAALATLVDDLFYRGANREREAVLRALHLLPQPERFVAIGVEACRSNVLSVFEAVAAENAYPSLHFPLSAFRQLVLKALFVGVSISRIEGLAGRADAELARMVEGYASERRAAGRSVPSDCERIISMAAAPAPATATATATAKE